MTKIIIYRPKGQKFSPCETVRELGKHGRQARMFAKSRTEKAQNQSPLSRVEQAVQFAEFAQHRAKRTACIDITHKPIGGSKNPTVRAKEKLKRGVCELI